MATPKKMKTDSPAAGEKKARKKRAPNTDPSKGLVIPAAAFDGVAETARKVGLKPGTLMRLIKAAIYLRANAAIAALGDELNPTGIARSYFADRVAALGDEPAEVDIDLDDDTDLDTDLDDDAEAA